MSDNPILVEIAHHWLTTVRKLPPQVATDILTDRNNDIAVEALNTARFVLKALESAGEKHE